MWFEAKLKCPADVGTLNTAVKEAVKKITPAKKLDWS